jgi:hypothetical protein
VRHRSIDEGRRGLRCSPWEGSVVASIPNLLMWVAESSDELDKHHMGVGLVQTRESEGESFSGDVYPR